MAASAILLGTLVPIHASSAATWRSLGPDAAVTVRLVFVPSRPGVVLAATGNGVFVSEDSGEHWTERGLQGMEVRDLAASPADPELMLALASPLESQGSITNLYRSTNGGASWTLSGPSPNLAFGAVLALHPGDPAIAWIAAGSGLSRSTDGGQTWQPLATAFWGSYPPRQLVPTPTPSGRLYGIGGGVGRGVCRSEDLGDTWVCFPQSLPESAWYATDLAVDPADDRHLAVATNGGLFTSHDAGESWTAVTVGTSVPDYFSEVEFAPNAPRVVYARSFRSLAASADGGATWAWVPCLSPGLPCAADTGGFGRLAVAPDDALAVWQVGVGWDLMRSPDGGRTWLRRTTGLRNAYVTALNTEPSGRIWAGSQLQGVFHSSDAGARWTPASGDLPYYGSGFEQPYFTVWGFAVGESPSSRYAATSWGLYATHDDGATWSGLLPWRCLTSVLANTGAPQQVLVGAESCGLDAGGLLRSDNGGTTWTDVSPVHDQTTVGALLRDPHHPQTVLAAGEIWLGGTWVGVLRSDDGGLTWIQGMGVPASKALALAADPILAGTLYLGTRSGGVFRSSDLGLSWQPASSGLPGWAPATWYEVQALLADPNRPGTVYAGTWSGVFVSRDRGDTWVPLGDVFPPFEVRALALADGGRTLLAGTYGAGVLALDLSAPRPPRRVLVHAP